MKSSLNCMSVLFLVVLVAYPKNAGYPDRHMVNLPRGNIIQKLFYLILT